MHRTTPALRVALAAAALLSASAARAQFPITESFMNGTAPGWSILGDAALTGGGVDPAGQGWLRLTSAGTDQAGTAIYTTAFPSTNGISITFDYADYGGSGADGFSFYLIDGTTPNNQITVGSSGGPLGYAAKYNAGDCASGPLTVLNPGVRNGYVGIGFDEFGNFSACESGVASPGRTPQSVVIRGSGTRVASGNTQTAFRYLTGKTVASVQAGTRIDNVQRAAPRKARVSIVNQRISVWMDFGAGFVNVINGYDLSTATGQLALPATFKMGLSGSTGGSTNVHEIRNVRVELPANLTLAQAVSPGTVSVTGTVTFTITVSNDATNAALGSALTDAFPAGLSNVTWTAATTGGATVGRASGTGNLAETVNLPKNSSVTYTVTATVTAAAAGTTLTNTVTLAPPAGVANLLSNTIATSLVVDKMGSATALASGANPSRFGQPVTLTATVTPVAPGSGTPAGTVTFLDGGVSIGTAALDAAGVATLSTSALAVGSHALTASYGGAANFNGSTSAPALSQVVNQALTATALASGANPSVAGQPVTLTATVTAQAPGAGTPGGTVTFLDGGVSIGTVALGAGGVATLTTSALAVATHSLTASYGGAASFAASTSPGLSQVVNKVTPSRVVASGTNPSRVGQPVTFTATLAATAPGTGTPTGTITFLDGGVSIGTGVLDAAGVATLTTSALPAGSRSITVSYPGDARFLPVTSAALTQVVNAAATSTALASGTNPSVTGQAVTFTATVTAIAPGGGTPAGQVGFFDGAAPLGTAALDGAGVATLTTSALAAGSHAVTAAYVATASHLASTSPAVTQVVGRAATQTALAAAGGTPVTGQARTFTATVTAVAPGAGTPAGTVTFSEGATILGTVALDAAGTASLPVALAAGGHTLTATYGGSAAFAGSSGTAAAPVGQAASATTLSAGPTPALFGEAVLLQAAVAPVAPGAGAPTGTVTFLDGATVLGTAAVDGAGHASLTVSTLAVGPHALSAAYGGDAGFLGSASAQADVAVVPASTTTAVASSLLTATFGDPLTFSADVAVVAPGAGTPGGAVRFFAGGVALGDGLLDAAGHASLAVAGGTLVAGAHEITAAYLGDGSFQGSTSASITQSVARAPTAVAVAGPGATVTGQAATFTATVTVPAGLRAAGGTVTFLDGATPLGTAPLDAAGQATLTTAGLAPGLHSITATYAGDADYAGSGSAAAPHQVDPAATATALAAAPSPSVFGSPVTLDATVTASAPGAGTPGGTVTFLDGPAVLGTATLDAAGRASLPTAALAGGVRSLTARYEGDGAFAGSTSPPLAQQVNPAPSSLALAASPSPSVLGEAVTLTATVTSAAGTPAGTVTFRDGATLLGTAPVGGGAASLTLSTLAIGPHALTADFSGSPEVAASSGAATHAVTQAAAAVALAAAPSPAVTGQPVSLTVLVTARAPGAGTPTGDVRLLDGGVPLGTATLAGGAATFTTADLAVGVHALTAEFLGDAGFLPGATADPTLLAVDPAATATALAGSAPASVFTEPVTFTATVTVLAPGAGVPTGTVTFAEGTTTLGTAPVQPDGTAALILPALPVGPHDVVATYGGDPSFALSVSDPVHHLVLEAAIAVNVSVTATPSVAGQPVTFTVTVTPVAPALGPVSGSVTLRGAGPDLGPTALDAAGQATFTTALPIGTYAVFADFTGPGFAPTSSTGLAHQVDPAATATTLAAAPAPSVSGEVVRLSAAVAVLAPGAGTPVGSVTFLDGGVPVGTGVLDGSGVATLDLPLLAGAHALTAAYLGDVGFLPSTSAALAQQVDPGATVTAAAASPSPAVYGEPLTLTADVSVLPPAPPFPAGLVTFTVDGLPVGGAALSGGQASLAVPPGLAAGLHEVVATYAGSSEHSGSASAPVALLVTPAPVTLALAASPSPGRAGEPTVLRATAAAAFGVPAGTVTFTDGGAVLGTAALDATGTAELTVGPGTLQVGAHALAVALPASANYGAGAATASLQVDRAPSTTDLAAAPGAPVTGQAVSFTATVTPASPAAGVPAGTVTFLEGSTVLGTATLVPAGAGAQATFATAALAIGPHAVTASFPGDAALLPSTSPAAPVTVGPAATALALAAAPSPSVFGQAVTLAAQVTVVAPGAGAPAGTVTFRDGGAVLGTGVLDGAGRATLTTAALAGGAHALSASWPGDAAFLGASGGALLDVAPAPTATALQALPVGTALGEPVTLVATVTSAGGTPAGTVTFRDGATTLGSAPLAGGAASISVSSLALGAHALSADYAGSADFAASAGSTSHLVGQAAADVALAAAPNPAVAGQPVALTVLVTDRGAGAGTPTGSVRILDGGVLLATVPLSAGVATFGTADLPVGVHALTAEYDGDGSFVPTATAAPTLLAIDPAATATALAASAPASVFTQPVTFTATVTVLAPGAGAPAGTVTFTEGTTTLGTAAVEADGTAALSLPALSVGPHDVVATYGGDPSFALSVSAPVRHEVLAATALVAIAAAPSPSGPGQAVTFTVSVAPVAPALGPVAGTVTLREGAAVLGTATLDAAGQATFTTSALQVGAHTLTADFGDPAAGFADASSAGLVHQVAAAASTTAVAASPSPATYGQAVTLAATVGVVAPSTVTPAGTVDFLVDGAAAGSAPVVAGQATLVLPAGALHAGPHQVSASYAGSAELAGSASPAVPLQVGPAPVTLALGADPAAPVAGQPVTLRAIATSAAGTPGGLVTFTDGPTVLGAAPLDAAGVATLPVGPLAVGAHALAATLPASADFGAGAAATALEVARAASVTTLAADLASAVSGQPVTFTATVSAVAPGAALPATEVTFLDGTTVLGTAALAPAGAGAVAILTTGTLAPGAHAVTASFGGSPTLAASTSAPAGVAVAPATTSLALTAEPTPSTFGQAVTLTARVTVDAPGAGAPAGDVTFFDGAGVLGTAALDATGRATLTTAALPPGARALSASWAAAGPLLGSTGLAVHPVGPAATTLVLSTPQQVVDLGQPVTLTAEVTVQAPGAGTPAGEVTFLDGATVLGTAPLDGAGRAVLVTASLAAGPHDLAASWPGATGLLPSEAHALLDVGHAVTVAAVVADRAASTYGQPVTFTATVAAAGGAPGVPTGLVTFRDQLATLGTAPLDATGHATLTTSALVAARHDVSVDYAGAGGFLSASSAVPATVDVGRAPTQVVLQPSAASVAAGEPVTLTATVTSVDAAAGTPGGTVSFWDGATLLETAPANASGVYTVVVTLRPGAHALRAEAFGDANHLPSTGAAGVTVARGATAMAVATSRTPSRRGRPVTFTATVTADAPAAGSVEFWDDSGATPVLLGTAALGDGAARLTTRDLAKGSHPIRAEYLGSADLAPASGALPGGQLVLNNAPVAGAGTALSLGGPGAAASAARAAVTLPAAAVEAVAGTVELWARAGWTDPAQAGAAPILVQRTGPGVVRWKLGVAPDRRAVEVAVGAATATIPAALDDGAWHHLALVGEASGTTLLVDGVEAGALAEPFGPAGATELAVGDGFVGELDELRTWTVARTAAELAADARRPLGGAEPGLTGLWRFDEGDGLELLDAGPLHLDLAIALVDPAAATPAAFAPSTAWRDRQVASGEPMAPAAAGYDADGDPLTLTVTGPPAHGAATADQQALAVGYASAAGFGGADTLTFTLSDGEATSAYTLAIEVAPPPPPTACTATSQCGGGSVCYQGACVPEHRLDVRSGGCGCGNAGGGAVALWSILSLALLRRRRPARAAEGRAP